jgi:hypothetical protein
MQADEYDESAAREIIRLVRSSWPEAWHEIKAPHANTVMVETGGAWLYVSVVSFAKPYTLAQLYSNGNPGVSWSCQEERDYPRSRVAERMIQRLRPWLPAVQWEGASGTALDFYVHQCTVTSDSNAISGFSIDHTGSCGAWSRFGPMDMRSAAAWHGSRHVVISAVLNGEERQYAEFIRNEETERSVEARKHFPRPEQDASA